VTNKASEPQAAKGHQVRARWTKPDDLRPVMAQHVHVALIEGAYYLTFGQIQVPEEIGEPKPPESLEVRSVATIAIPATLMPKIAKFLMDRVAEAGVDND
jgi:hypothetical protein